MTNVRHVKACALCGHSVRTGTVCLATAACAERHRDDQLKAAQIVAGKAASKMPVLGAGGLAAMF